MARYFDGSQQSNNKTRRQQEDQRRMEYRRAIESYSEQRQLLQEIADYPELQSISLWQVSAVNAPKSAQPAR